LLDTAGIRDSDDPVEQEGVRRARERAGGADLVLWVVDSAGNESLTMHDFGTEFPEASKWLVRNKSDLVRAKNDIRTSKIYTFDDRPSGDVGQAFAVSAKTGEGVDALIGALTAYARDHLGSTEPALVTRERQRQALEQTSAALGRALGEAGPDREDVLAEELRLAARALGRLTGRVDVEDVLDVIFRDFCIGK
jgi:tRNA modification GTPase